MIINKTWKKLCERIHIHTYILAYTYIYTYTHTYIHAHMCYFQVYNDIIQ